MLLFSAGQLIEKGPPYEPAKANYGVVHSAWVVDPQKMLVAADITLPPPPDGHFDLDDIDIFDADTGEYFGSGPDIYRTTLKGDFIAERDPEVDAQVEYRGVFVWTVRPGVKHVNFGYWGDMMYVKPIAVARSGRKLPPARAQSVTALSAAGDDRYRIILAAQNWWRSDDPESYALAVDRNICKQERWIELDEHDAPIAVKLEQRPYMLPQRRFLIECRCPAGVKPEKLDRFGERWPLPAMGVLKLPQSTLDALAKR